MPTCCIDVWVLNDVSFGKCGLSADLACLACEVTTRQSSLGMHDGEVPVDLAGSFSRAITALYPQSYDNGTFSSSWGSERMKLSARSINDGAFDRPCRVLKVAMSSLGCSAFFNGTSKNCFKRF